MPKQAGNIILIQELQKYAETEEVPKYTLKQKRPSKLDPYKDYIDALLEEDNYSAALILERIR